MGGRADTEPCMKRNAPRRAEGVGLGILSPRGLTDMHLGSISQVYPMQPQSQVIMGPFRPRRAYLASLASPCLQRS